MMPGPRTVAGLNEPATMMSPPRRLGRQAFSSASLKVGKAWRSGSAAAAVRAPCIWPSMICCVVNDRP
jgi:hypothetical protein